MKAPLTFVVAGAARAGSTAVVEALRAHPDVFVTQPKEPHYLALGDRPACFTGPGDDETINRFAVTDEAAYDALYRGGSEHVARGEGSVSTLYYNQRAAQRLHALSPDAKIVLVLREPVARAYSSHQYLLNRGYEPVADFLDAVGMEKGRMAAGWHHLWHYTAMSRYADAVAHFRATFGSDAVGVWWYDDLQADSRRCLAEIQRFIGVDPDRAAQDEVQRVNASGVPRRQWVQTAMHKAAERPQLKAAVKAIVPFAVRERIRSANLAANDVPASVHSALAPSFASDLDRLEDVLVRPVPQSWRSPRVAS
jgi:hypothetical protein